MGVLQNLIFITSNYIYFNLMLILISNKWCLLKAAFSWKTMWVVIYSKILWIYSDKFTKTFNQIFYLPRTNESLLSKGSFSKQHFDKRTLCQKCKISCSVKTTTCSHTNFRESFLQWNSYSKSFIVNKYAIVTFWNNITYMVNAFVSSLDIRVIF